MISSQQIKYLVTISDFGSISLAAKHLGVTQPTLSMQVKKVEEILNTIIFDREKSPIIATLRGEKIIKQCRRSLKEIEKINLLASSSEISGDIKIGVIPTVAPYLVPLFANLIQQKHPTLKTTYLERQTDDLIRDLKNEKLDFGILATPLFDEQIYEFPLYYESFRFLFNKENTLLKKDRVKISDLENQQIYQLEDGHCLRFQTEQICQKIKGKIKSNLFIEGGQLETLVNFTKKYGGATLVPELYYHHCSIQEKKLMRNIDGKPLTREISLISVRYFSKEDIGNMLIEEISNALPDTVRSLRKSSVKIIPIS